MSAPPRGPWARGFGVTLSPARGAPGEALLRALCDGVARGYDGPLPAAAAEARCFAVRAGGEEVALIVVERGAPSPGAATIAAVAVAPAHRGRGYGTRALLAAERRLRREGVTACFARVPRGNGRGLYFMLRAGYAPVPPPGGASGAAEVGVVDGATWFRRAGR